MKLLVTGGAGFIGSAFIRLVLRERAAWSVVNVDTLTYAGNLENLAEVETNSRYQFVKADITDGKAIQEVLSNGLDAIVHFAAESHVDRSIQDSHPFIATNVLGTQILLDAARARKVPRFLHISTDEVYGSLGETGHFTEDSPLQPNSPYAATKAAADLLVRAAFVTHKMGALITRSSNNYGPYQFPEKLIPLMITNAMDDQPLPVYGKGENVRDWTYVDDNARGILTVLEKGKDGEVYNIGAGEERRNLEICEIILKELGKSRSLLRFVTDRPGHDWRYALKSDKVRALGWSPALDLPRGLHQTVEWYKAQRTWWERVKSGEYKNYYEQAYGRRLQAARAR
ncbi:MAG: dTDP-glucose 4,6-dehydratase [Nitrospirae bacterium]|nr:dTDP-glucose 4,6-dehydratase [Nitrospirota bacterium]